MANFASYSFTANSKFQRVQSIVLRLEGGYQRMVDDGGNWYCTQAVASAAGISPMGCNKNIPGAQLIGTKYGISGRVYGGRYDVPGMTQDDARQIYYNDYYSNTPAASLEWPSDLIYFDSAVNHGVGGARTLWARAGGDPRRMLEERRKWYNERVAKDPTQRRFLAGWLDRVDQLEKYLDSGYSQPKYVVDDTGSKTVSGGSAIVLTTNADKAAITQPCPATD